MACHTENLCGKLRNRKKGQKGDAMQKKSNILKYLHYLFLIKKRERALFKKIGRENRKSGWHVYCLAYGRIPKTLIDERILRKLQKKESH